jgi:conjugal transfer pilus assembly protein TraE
MKMNIFMQKTSNLMAENRLLKFAVLVIGITVIYNTFMVRHALHTHRTILVPPAIKSTMEIHGNSASDAYIKHFTRYIMGLAFQYSPATARYQFEELLSMFSPSSFPRAQKMFYDLADTIETAQISNVFYIQKMVLDSARKQVEVTGLKRQYVHDVKSEEGTKTYIVVYEFEDGRFMIADISEKEILDEEAKEERRERRD